MTQEHNTQPASPRQNARPNFPPDSIPAEQGGYLVCTAPSRIEFVSGAARAWINLPGVATSVFEVIRALAARGEETAEVELPQGVIALTRLEGHNGFSYLVNISASALPRAVVKAQLSPKQWEVAEFAAAGATIPEIARHFKRSPETVRTHIRQIYRRLDVASRLELARVLAVAR